MSLDWLDFELSDDSEGLCCFDALASVWPAQWPAVLAELREVLDWAGRQFGPAAPLDEDGHWDVDLQAWLDSEPPQALALDLQRPSGLSAPAEALAAASAARRTLAVALSVTPGLAEALRQRFGLTL